ncbi:MAG: hypothetical protein JWN93_1966 [Hyphomicrobiales bacterium]|nr:hypothetical protein [Hyphomicrobiales bacterium]
MSVKKAALALTAGMLLAGALTGCGRRGNLETPGAPAGQSASPQSAGQQPVAGRYSLGGQSTQAADDVETPVVAPKRDFFLDGIL